MLKLDLMTDLESENSEVTCMINSYNIKRKFVDQVPYYGLRSYEKIGRPI
jgi:hypothetical protein